MSELCSKTDIMWCACRCGVRMARRWFIVWRESAALPPCALPTSWNTRECLWGKLSAISGRDDLRSGRTVAFSVSWSSSRGGCSVLPRYPWCTTKLRETSYRMYTRRSIRTCCGTSNITTTNLEGTDSRYSPCFFLIYLFLFLNSTGIVAWLFVYQILYPKTSFSCPCPRFYSVHVTFQITRRSLERCTLILYKFNTQINL